MTNPLYNEISNSQMSQFMQQFNQLKQNINGNPQQIVQQMLNSGQMSQAQFNQLAKQANQLMAMMPKQ